MSMDYEKAKRNAKPKERPRRKKRVTAVHPNSMAAKKWGRTTWNTTVLPDTSKKKRSKKRSNSSGAAKPARRVKP